TIFAGSHDKSVLAVYSGQVDGAASFIDARTDAGMPADVMAKTKVIDTAGPIPNDGSAVAKGFPPDLHAQVTKALIDYCASHADPRRVAPVPAATALGQPDPPGTRAFDGLPLAMGRGEFPALLGASGGASRRSSAASPGSSTRRQARSRSTARTSRGQVAGTC